MTPKPAIERNDSEARAVEDLKAMVPDVIGCLISIVRAGTSNNRDNVEIASEKAQAHAAALIDKIVDFAER